MLNCARAHFVCSPVRRLGGYFWFELIPLNLLFVYLLMRQEMMAESVLQLVMRNRNGSLDQLPICAGGENENALSADGSPRPS
jgi:hypothetical protein